MSKTSKTSPSFFKKNVLVVGLGRSGIAACVLLRKYGCAITATDVREQSALTTDVRNLQDEGVKLSLGGHDPALIKGKDLVVLSPGVPRSIALIQEALKAGLPVLSEIEIASEVARAPILAVTGTNGKSTVVTLLGTILSSAGLEVAVAGNIGVALSAVVEDVPSEGVIVAEISSFQLESIAKFHPKVAVLLNITPDHLDRYDRLGSYIEAKARLFSNLKPSDFAVYNADDPFVPPLVTPLTAGLLSFSFRERRVKDGAFVRGGAFWLRRSGEEFEVTRENNVALRGPHNFSNILASICAASALGLTAEQMKRPLEQFKGLEHRLEEVAEIDGVSFVNDSKATNVDSLKYSLLSFDNPIVLIAGGRDKGGNFSTLKQLVAERVKELVLVGEASQKISSSWSGTRAHLAQSMAEAVETAFKLAAPRDVVLLAPGCASFDMFKDFEDRGRAFKNAVLSLVRGSAETRGDNTASADATAKRDGGAKGKPDA
ncbi:MAG: UDP-N-acetylmuramoyl-L-alanine--D-glutamate ligase [Candidatus Eisenbacteria bacterium]|nr:UDP-N-acetylmuramoyl-L-alanine--D-glutamate ligase [Candidatus Eisenbacteria bacterium]